MTTRLWQNSDSHRLPLRSGTRGVTKVEARVYRRVAGRLFHAVVRLYAIRGFNDTQCGFKLFDAAAAHDLFSRMRMNGYSFDVEVLLMAHRAGYRVAEVPVNWTHQRGSKVHVLRDGLRMAGRCTSHSGQCCSAASTISPHIALPESAPATPSATVGFLASGTAPPIAAHCAARRGSDELITGSTERGIGPISPAFEPTTAPSPIGRSCGRTRDLTCDRDLAPSRAVSRTGAIGNEREDCQVRVAPGLQRKVARHRGRNTFRPSYEGKNVRPSMDSESMEVAREHSPRS